MERTDFSSKGMISDEWIYRKNRKKKNEEKSQKQKNSNSPANAVKERNKRLEGKLKNL